MNAFSVLLSSRFFRSANWLSRKNGGSLPVAVLSGTLLCLLGMTLPASAQNTIDTVAGGGTVNPSALLADIPGPTAALTDASGNLYVAAPFSQYVFKVSSSGVVSQWAGTGVIAYFNQPGPANQRSLWNPSGLAIDKNGNIYIADSLNNTVRVVNPSGTIHTIAGRSEPCDGTSQCGDGRPAVEAFLNNPQGVAVDDDGNVYIADTGDNRIRVVRTTGQIVAFAGNWNVPLCTVPTDPCGDGGRAVNANIGRGPVSVAADHNGNVYFADTGDNRIRVVNTTTHKITAFAGNGNQCAPIFGACGDGGSALTATMGPPRGIALDSANNLYIADTKDNRIRMVSSGTMSTFAGSYKPDNHGFSGDGGSPTKALLASPNGVFADANGNVFISDTGNQRVRAVPAHADLIVTVLGGGDGGDGGAATAAQFANPFAVALDGADTYYVVDTANNRIRKVSGGNISTVAGHGEANYTGENGPATSATLNAPEGVAVDSAGSLIIADTLNRRVRQVSGGTISLLAGSGQPCPASPSSCGDGGPPASALLTGPSTVAVDAAGNIFIADPPSNRIREITGGVIKTVAGTGPCDNTGDNAPAVNAQLCKPVGLTLDSSGNIFIADSGNNVIRCVLAVAGGCRDSTHQHNVGDIVLYAYTGKTQFFQDEDGGPAKKANRFNPTEVAVDARGNLFIGGGNDALVQRVDAATGIIVTVAGNDAQWWWYGFRGDGHAANKARIDNSGLAVSANEDLFIADNGNNRIREVAQMVPVSNFDPKSLSFGSVAVGQTSAPLPITLLNTGSDDMDITSIASSGDYAQTNNCPAGSHMLAPGVSCTINVTFTPQKKGPLNGKISVTDNAPKSPQTVKLTGTGQ